MSAGRAPPAPSSIVSFCHVQKWTGSRATETTGKGLTKNKKEQNCIVLRDASSHTGINHPLTEASCDLIEEAAAITAFAVPHTPITGLPFTNR